jgi:hypothetical protein
MPAGQRRTGHDIREVQVLVHIRNQFSSTGRQWLDSADGAKWDEVAEHYRKGDRRID